MGKQGLEGGKRKAVFQKEVQKRKKSLRKGMKLRQKKKKDPVHQEKGKEERSSFACKNHGKEKKRVPRGKKWAFWQKAQRGGAFQKKNQKTLQGPVEGKS